MTRSTTGSAKNARVLFRCWMFIAASTYLGFFSAAVVLAFQPISHYASHFRSSSATATRLERKSSARLHQSSLSNSLNETDWSRMSEDERRRNTTAAAAAASVGSREVVVEIITHPKRLSFLSGVKFLLASAKGEAHLYLNHLREKHGDAFIIWNRYVTIHDKDAIRDVLETYNLPKPEIVLRGYQFCFGSGSILSAPWEEWKVQRRMTNAALMEASIGALRPRLVKGLRPILTILEQAAESGTVVEMDSIFQAASTDIIGLIIFGKSLERAEKLGISSKNRKSSRNSNELDTFTALERMKAETQRQMVMPLWILNRFGPSKKVLEAKQYLDTFLEECISERLDMEVEEREAFTDLMSVLLESYENGTITRKEVKGQLLTFLFAGQDTTAHTMTWMLYEISQDSQLQEQLAEEAKKALPKRDSFADRELLQSNELGLLDRCFSETLRKYPAAATGSGRLVAGETPIVVGGGGGGDSFPIELPPGASITIPPYSLHRNPKYWPDPERFDPDRFLLELVKKRDPMTFQAFSAGPRNCVGSRLARIEALTAMSALLRRFHIKCVEKKLPPKQFLSLTMKPKHGIRFLLTKRD